MRAAANAVRGIRVIGRVAKGTVDLKRAAAADAKTIRRVVKRLTARAQELVNRLRVGQDQDRAARGATKLRVRLNVGGRGRAARGTTKQIHFHIHLGEASKRDWFCLKQSDCLRVGHYFTPKQSDCFWRLRTARQPRQSSRVRQISNSPYNGPTPGDLTFWRAVVEKQRADA